MGIEQDQSSDAEISPLIWVVFSLCVAAFVLGWVIIALCERTERKRNRCVCARAYGDECICGRCERWNEKKF